jgi:hypothetical protein
MVDLLEKNGSLIELTIVSGLRKVNMEGKQTTRE